VHQHHGYLLGELIAQENRRNIRQHHADRRPGDNRDQVVVPGGQRDRRDLRLVAHFGQEKRDDRRSVDAKARRAAQCRLIGLVGDQHPRRHGQEAHADHPAQDGGSQLRGHPLPNDAREYMVYQGCGQNAQDDRHRALKLRRQQEREQLRLVAHFPKRDDSE
jgi:hypothetical protein